MMHKLTAFTLTLLALSLILVCAGCTTSTSTATTTTTSTVTTTLVPGSTSISGTVTFPSGSWGCLWVGATTDNTFMATTGWKEMEYPVATGETTKSYTIPISVPGTYYILAILAKGRTTFAGSTEPSANDLLGEYADGNIVAGYGKTPTGTPTAIVVAGGSILVGKDFSLNVTW